MLHVIRPKLKGHIYHFYIHQNHSKTQRFPSFSHLLAQFPQFAQLLPCTVQLRLQLLHLPRQLLDALFRKVVFLAQQLNNIVCVVVEHGTGNWNQDCTAAIGSISRWTLYRLAPWAAFFQRQPDWKGFFFLFFFFLFSFSVLCIHTLHIAFAVPRLIESFKSFNACALTFPRLISGTSWNEKRSVSSGRVDLMRSGLISMPVCDTLVLSI